VEIRDSYTRWIVATTEGYCKDPKKQVTVGHIYECTEDWNATQIIKCAAESVLCGHLCTSAPWWACVACLVLEGIDCALDGVCTFVEDCVRGDEIIPIERDVVDYEGDWGNFQKCGIIS
jgi:hypothetical protein